MNLKKKITDGAITIIHCDSQKLHFLNEKDVLLILNEINNSF